MNFFDDLDTSQFSVLDAHTLENLEQVADERIIDTRREHDSKRSTYVISEHFTKVYDSVKHVLQSYGKELRVQYALIQIDDRSKTNNSDSIFLKLYLNFSDKDRKYLSDIRGKFSSCTVSPSDVEIRDFKKFGLTLKGRDPQRNKWFDRNPLVDVYKYLLPKVDKYFKSKSLNGLSNISRAGPTNSIAESILNFPTVIQPNEIVKLKRHYEEQIKIMQQQIIQLQYQIQPSVRSTAESLFSSISREEAKEELTAQSILSDESRSEESKSNQSDREFIVDDDNDNKSSLQDNSVIQPQGSFLRNFVSRSFNSLRGLTDRFEKPVSKKLKTELLPQNSDQI